MRGAILAFAAGVVLLQQQAALPAYLWLGALLPVLALPWSRSARLRWTGVVLLAFGAGFFYAAWRAELRLADALAPAWEGRDVQVVGVVAALPQHTERGLRFVFDVEEVVTPGAQLPRRLQLFWFNRWAAGEEGAHLDPARLRPGERWQFMVRLKRPHGTANPHGFDYEAWLLERGLRATGYVRLDPGNFRLGTLVWRPAYLIERVRDGMAKRLRRILHEAPYGGVITALAIGDQNAIPQAQWRVFFRTGLNHLMSISGLHVTLFSSLVFFLTNALWRRSPRLTQRLPARKAGVLAGVGAALGYALLSGFAIPTQRTLYMLGAVALAVWFDRLSSPSRVMALALAAVLLVDPWAVLAPGFWLSFGAVALIFYVSALRLGTPPAWRQALRVQGAVTLGLIPPMLLLFQQVSLLSPLANAVAVPLISYLVVPLTLLGAFTPFDLPLHLAHRLLAIAMPLFEWMAARPDVLWQQHAPPTWTVALALAGVAWLLAPRGWPARWAGACLFLPMFLLRPPTPAPGTLQMTVLDVGQGLATVLRTTHHALLFDAGARFSADSDAGSRIVLPYLRGSGVQRLDGFIVSHDDNDHAGGAQAVLDAMPVAWFASSLAAEHPLRRHPVPASRCEAGQRWTWDGVGFEILHPAPAHYAEKRKDNDLSCVLRVNVGDQTVLIAADIEAKSERDLLAAAPDKLRAEVLIVPHHGSRTSSTEAFIAAVAPSVAVFTVGYRNRFGHPKDQVVARYAAAGARLLRTDATGALTFELSGRSPPRVTAHREVRPRYWQGR